MTKIVLMAAAFAAMLFGTSIESRAASLVANIDVSSQTMTDTAVGADDLYAELIVLVERYLRP